MENPQVLIPVRHVDLNVNVDGGMGSTMTDFPLQPSELILVYVQEKEVPARHFTRNRQVVLDACTKAAAAKVEREELEIRWAEQARQKKSRKNYRSERIMQSEYLT